jgi:deoxycytidylate deaminase
MKLTFTKSFAELAELLTSLGGTWDESQPRKKVLRHEGGVLNWFETTGTISFQGPEQASKSLEANVKYLLYPNEFPDPDSINAATAAAEIAKDHIIGTESSPSEKYLLGKFDNSELIIGLVSAVGTETSRVVTPLKDRLTRFGYTAIEIKLSSLLPQPASDSGEYHRIKELMKAGDDLREKESNNGILAYGASKLIMLSRPSGDGKTAYIVNSLKHPDEVEVLRKIYGQGFYLFGVHADKKRRLHYLEQDKGLTAMQAAELTEVDEDEKLAHGQRTRDTYHLADFFLNFGKNDDQVKNTVLRFLELIFSHPFKNPTFDEFAMFMAFSSSVRSGDLSRQVGAVITRNQQILATGANECPASGGGLYWAEVDPESGIVKDVQDGKDYTRNEDSNRAEQNEIIRGILDGISQLEGVGSDVLGGVEYQLKQSRIRDLTEFGRVVHAEMEAILSCAREGINCTGGTLYCTTFPCHNCAKHLIAAGIKRVVYVEPYPKSKALDFHSESIELRTSNEVDAKAEQVLFEPFTGVGARRFLDLFSMSLGAGNKLRRKDSDGNAVSWEQSSSLPRVALLPESYRNVESTAAALFVRAGGT